MTDWRKEWFDFEDAAYLNVAGQGPLPKTSVQATLRAIEWKKFPHTMPDSTIFDLPNRIRASAAKLIGGRPEEIAITTGASAGMAAVANGIDWKPGDEVLIAQGEFPSHFSTFLPLEAAGKLKVKVIMPAGRFHTTDDFLKHIGPHTRLVSASLVRFDNGVRLDAAKVAQACHSVGGFLLLDVAQCAGAVPMNVDKLGADFVAASGYKWLLSPYGTGFFWARGAAIDQMLPGPSYWSALENADRFDRLSGNGYKLRAGAMRWDSPETGSFFNLTAMDASLEFILRVGVETIWEHTGHLAEALIARLPLDRCVLASPAAADERGTYICVTARKPERIAELHARLIEARVFVSLREGALRIAPHLFNSERDLDRLLTVLSV
jgi:cysteine desulfurase / selenocysteine lyase